MRVPSSRESTSRRTLRVAVVVLVWWAVWPCQLAHAQAEGSPAPTESNKTTAKAPERYTFELGSFNLREIRPTRNETTDINFTAYLAMAPGVTKEEVQRLENWKHRLRDHVIVAVRTAETVDFQEPDLERLRRIILFRVRRLLKENIVQDILLSEFTFKTE